MYVKTFAKRIPAKIPIMRLNDAIIPAVEALDESETETGA